MSISIQCACGKTLRVPESARGKQGRCPSCAARITVPALPVAPADDLELMPAAVESPRVTPRVVAAPVAAVVAAPSSNALRATPEKAPAWRRFMYLILLLGLIPLVLHTIREPNRTPEQREQEYEERFKQSIAENLRDHPEITPAVLEVLEKIQDDQATGDDLMAVLPTHRLAGAFLPRNSWGHWGMAGVSAAGAFMLLIAMFPTAIKRSLALLLTGVFTGTIGILLLLGFQYAAQFSNGVEIHGSYGRIGIIILILKLIGWSYSLADSADAGFVLSFVGYTCGVGLCEEITKSIPILFRVRHVPGEREARWNDLLLLGLASGFGFGIAEGIMYSSRYYNGIEPGSMYLVRFVSCVVLHAIWAGAIGVTVYNRQGWLSTDSWWGYWGYVVLIVLVPMVLHGLYDTLLKMEYNAWALGIALASFGWLAFQIERMHRNEPAGALA